MHAVSADNHPPQVITSRRLGMKRLIYNRIESEKIKKHEPKFFSFSFLRFFRTTFLDYFTVCRFPFVHDK